MMIDFLENSESIGVWEDFIGVLQKRKGYFAL